MVAQQLHASGPRGPKRLAGSGTPATRGGPRSCSIDVKAQPTQLPLAVRSARQGSGPLPAGDAASGDRGSRLEQPAGAACLKVCRVVAAQPADKEPGVEHLLRGWGGACRQRDGVTARGHSAGPRANRAPAALPLRAGRSRDQIMHAGRWEKAVWSCLSRWDRLARRLALGTLVPVWGPRRRCLDTSEVLRIRPCCPAGTRLEQLEVSSCGWPVHFQPDPKVELVDGVAEAAGQGCRNQGQQVSSSTLACWPALLARARTGHRLAPSP